MADKESKTRSKTDDASKAPAGPVLIFNRRGGIYKCVGHKPAMHGGKAVSAGTGVSAMNEFSLMLFPGVNLVERARYEFVKENPGFKSRLAKREVIVSARPWGEVAEGECLDMARISANLPTLADLLESETRTTVAHALETALEVATRTVRKEKPHLTPVQVARLGRPELRR